MNNNVITDNPKIRGQCIRWQRQHWNCHYIFRFSLSMIFFLCVWVFFFRILVERNANRVDRDHQPLMHVWCVYSLIHYKIRILIKKIEERRKANERTNNQLMHVSFKYNSLISIQNEKKSTRRSNEMVITVNLTTTDTPMTDVASYYLALNGRLK